MNIQSLEKLNLQFNQKIEVKIKEGKRILGYFRGYSYDKVSLMFGRENPWIVMWISYESTCTVPAGLRLHNIESIKKLYS